MYYVITDSYGALTEAQKQSNAYEFYNAMKGIATVEAISGILGNIERESQLNPGQQEGGYGGSLNYGYGLIQWTPATILVNWCTERNLNWYDGNAQIRRIIAEGNGTDGASGYWIPTDAYPYSWSEFLRLRDVEECTKAYLFERERAGVSALSERLDNARKWFNYLSTYSYTPRLTQDGIVGNHWYYADNPFYQSGYGLPNCTAYAWGRRAEITNIAPTLSLGNADSWWGYNIYHNIYPYGQTPQLGAIACWSYTGSHAGDGGHVGVVEVINEDGSIITSNSAYGGTLFYTQTLSPDNNYEWASYTNFEGFIYLEGGPLPPVPPTPTTSKKKKGYPWVIRNNMIRRTGL